MQRKLFAILTTIFATLAVVAMAPACKHDASPVTPIEEPNNGGGNGGTNNGGNNGGNQPSGVPCSPDSVYFANQVLPILVSNCAKSGCHDPASHQEGVVLSSFQSIMSTVDDVNDPDPDENDLLEVLYETDPDKRMPPPPNTPLSTSQRDVLVRWIQQGAQNNACNENYGGCDVANVTWVNFIQPLVAAKCQGCHSGSNPGGGIALTNYEQVKVIALNGKFHNVITRATNWMPKGGAKLDDCTAQKVKAWADAGAP